MSLVSAPAKFLFPSKFLWDHVHRAVDGFADWENRRIDTLVPCATWTAVELFLGILCPCLVTMGPLVTMSFHFLSSYASSFLSRGSSSRRSRGHSHIKEVRGGDNGIDSVERDVRQWGGGGKHHDEVNNEMVTVNVNAEEKEMDGLKMNGVQNPRHYLD